MIAIFAALALANWYLWSSTVKAHRDADQSVYVQRHGIAAVGTVTTVDNAVHKYGVEGGRLSGGLVVRSWAHALISVHLASPVHGASDTVVQYPDKSDLQVGSSVSVVVDPRDARYAELPGHGAQTKHGWVVLLVLSVMVASPLVFVLSAVLVGWPVSKRNSTPE